jgi:hypothetical protein
MEKYCSREVREIRRGLLSFLKGGEMGYIRHLWRR